MNSCNNENCSSCIFDILRKILILQKQNYDNDNYIGCDKPFLGPSISNVCYNTRPIQLYNCCTGTAWSFDFTNNGVDSTTNILRVESCDDCCCTCRLLSYDDTTSEYTNTNQFVTIDLKCCGAIRCLNDTNIDLC